MTSLTVDRLTTMPSQMSLWSYLAVIKNCLDTIVGEEASQRDLPAGTNPRVGKYQLNCGRYATKPIPRLK